MRALRYLCFWLALSLSQGGASPHPASVERSQRLPKISLGLGWSSLQTNKQTEQSLSAATWSIGATAQPLKKIPVWVGLHLGTQSWSYHTLTQTSESIRSDTTTYSLLIEVQYLFRSFGMLLPYLGLGVGPNLNVAVITYDNKTGGASQNTDAFWQWHFSIRPGLELPISETFSIAMQANVGTVGGDLLLQPEMNVRIDLSKLAPS